MAVPRPATPLQIALPGQNASLTADPNAQPQAPWWQVWRGLVLRTGGNSGIDSAVLQSDISDNTARITSFAAPKSTPIPPKPVGITVGSSPFSYQAQLTGNVLINGGTVSAVAISRDHTTFFSCPTAGFVPVFKGDVVKVTYSGLPTMTLIAS